MNRPFWSFRSSHSESCESIEPLLSLYADRMASPDEVRRVDTHLPDCGGCREALSWIQATHRALASRPVALPPPDLHSRIAQAIAASSAAPLFLRPARTFTLRPAYAAALSLSVLGLVLSYSLWHAPAETSVKPSAQPPRLASAPVVKTPHAPLGRAKSVRPLVVSPLVASNAPAAAEPRVLRPGAVKRLRKQTPLGEMTPQTSVASVIPAPVVPLTHIAPLPVKAPVHPRPPHDLTASGKIVPAKPRLPLVPEKTDAPNLSTAPLIANRPPAPAPVPVTILPPTVSVQTPPALTASASGNPPPSKLGDILGPVRAHIGLMRSAAFLTTHQSYRGASNVMHTLDTEHFAYIDGIHSP